MKGTDKIMVKYFNGDLLQSDCNVICHQVNCRGVMGAGIARTIREKYPQVFSVFRTSYAAGCNKLGEIDVVYIAEAKRFIVNMYAQYDYKPKGMVHTDYSAFESCIRKIKTEVSDYRKYHPEVGKVKIGFPYRIGCGLGGGDWTIVKSILEREFSGDEWNVEIWRLP